MCCISYNSFTLASALYVVEGWGRKNYHLLTHHVYLLFNHEQETPTQRGQCNELINISETSLRVFLSIALAFSLSLPGPMPTMITTNLKLGQTIPYQRLGLDAASVPPTTRVSPIADPNWQIAVSLCAENELLRRISGCNRDGTAKNPRVASLFSKTEHDRRNTATGVVILGAFFARRLITLSRWLDSLISLFAFMDWTVSVALVAIEFRQVFCWSICWKFVTAGSFCVARDVTWWGGQRKNTDEMLSGAELRFKLETICGSSIKESSSLLVDILGFVSDISRFSEPWRETIVGNAKSVAITNQNIFHKGFRGISIAPARILTETNKLQCR